MSQEARVTTGATEFDPLVMCDSVDSFDGRCSNAGIYEGEKPVDAALCGRFNLETGEEMSACSELGYCVMEGVVFVDLPAVATHDSRLLTQDSAPEVQNG